MDLIRNAINALFYNFPIESIAEEVAFRGTNNHHPNGMLDTLKEVLKWEDTSFTKSEMDLLGDVIDQNWAVSDEFSITTSGKSSIAQRFPLLLNEFSDKILCNYGFRSPVVRFNDLLRWRCLSLNIGEDLLVCAYLAAKDIRTRYKRDMFLWPLVLGHDNIRINAILDEELSDTHAHINASTDVFDFNWLILMNIPGAFPSSSDGNTANEKAGDCWSTGSRKSYDHVSRYSIFNHSLRNWVVVAAYIRALLYAKVFGHHTSLLRSEIVKMYKDRAFDYTPLGSLKSSVSILSSYALPTEKGFVLDYAIGKDDFNDSRIESPMVVNHGERKFLYSWFSAYFGNREEIREDADLMLLYLIIKNKVRREFIQTNELRGFGNFKEYNKVKWDFFPDAKSNKDLMMAYKELAYRYTVQSALESSDRIHLELRLSPSEIEYFYQWNHRRAIFSSKDKLAVDKDGQVSFVVHFLKDKEKKISDDRVPRHKTSRDSLFNDVEIIKKYLCNVYEGKPKIVGIDAAGSELNCRPEVFAPYFRQLRLLGVPHFTFHAGEDFYDILDGLRTIDELCCFMDYRFGDRIGHALALGMNVYDFYAERHNNIIVPKQILLDNLVWLKFASEERNLRLSPQTNLFIEEKFRELSDELGYMKNNGNIYDYHLSMRMRGDVPGDSTSWISDEVRYSPVSGGGKMGVDIRKLWETYELSAKCKRKGKEVIATTLPQSFASDVAALQERMLFDMEKKGVIIETNPSSNLKIGRFSRYDQHPILRFHELGFKESAHTMMVSINTDDQGVFGTSLKNEYSLVAVALSKVKNRDGQYKWSDAEIENYLRKIAYYGNISRFDNVND